MDGKELNINDGLRNTYFIPCCMICKVLMFLFHHLVLPVVF